MKEENPNEQYMKYLQQGGVNPQTYPENEPPCYRFENSGRHMRNNSIRKPQKVFRRDENEIRQNGGAYEDEMTAKNLKMSQYFNDIQRDNIKITSYQKNLINGMKPFQNNGLTTSQLLNNVDDLREPELSKKLTSKSQAQIFHKTKTAPYQNIFGYVRQSFNRVSSGPEEMIKNSNILSGHDNILHSKNSNHWDHYGSYSNIFNTISKSSNANMNNHGIVEEGMNTSQYLNKNIQSVKDFLKSNKSNNMTGLQGGVLHSEDRRTIQTFKPTNQ